MKDLIVLLLISIFLNSKELELNLQKNFEEKAKNFIFLLKEEKFEEAKGNLAELMIKALESKGIEIENLWYGLKEQVGEFKSIKKTKFNEEMGYKCIYLTTEFSKKALNIKVVYDKDEKIAGLFFLPLIEESYKMPSYAKPEIYEEFEYNFGKEKIKLTGVLTVPKGKGPYPLVILIHGSGPQDMDETIGPNKIFKDIALGLSSKGIAVFRYDKRTKTYPEDFSKNIDKFTIKEETTEDVKEAIKFLKELKNIKFSKIFLLGHSLGATMAPRIALEEKDIDGIILIAGIPYGFYINKVYEQTKYILSLDGELKSEDIEKLKEIEEQLKKIKDLEMKDGEIIMGASKKYWEDLLKYDPVEAIKKLKIPVFILQGGRDYQVTQEDFDIWKEKLKGRKNTEFKLYKDLNHLFIFGKGKSTPEEYEKQGNFSEDALEDISSWIKKQ